VPERDVENSYLAGDAVEGAPQDQLLAHSMMDTEVRMPREAGCRERPRPYKTARHKSQLLFVVRATVPLADRPTLDVREVENAKYCR
jgi:hypothetical protein